jgi:hypothetical protein
MIRKFGFKENVEDNCVYAKFKNEKYIFLILYVDDILLASSDVSILLETKKFLSSNFDMKDLGEASFVLGIEIHRDRSKGVLRPLKLYCNNSPAVQYAHNNKSSGAAKHIDIKYYVVKDKVRDHIISLEHISTEKMLADPLTKGLPPNVFREHVASMGLRESL